MIKKENGEIRVISKINKETLIQSKKLFLIALILAFFLSVIGFIFITVTFGIFGLCLVILDLILILICNRLLLKSDEEKLFLILNKDELIVKEKKICNTNEIISFSYNDVAGNLNELFLSYKTKRKHTKIIYLRGAKNKEFAGIANDYINDLK